MIQTASTAAIAETGNGRVAAQQKISALVGVPAEELKEFGRALAPLGDFDGDGVTDFVAGLPNDDTGEENFAAIVLLFLQSDGTLKGYRKISLTAG